MMREQKELRVTSMLNVSVGGWNYNIEVPLNVVEIIKAEDYLRK